MPFNNNGFAGLAPPDRDRGKRVLLDGSTASGFEKYVENHLIIVPHTLTRVLE